MASEITVVLEQVGPTTSEAHIRSHSVTIDRPVAKGGADHGPMGGELLLAALAGCFSSTLYAAIAARGADVRDVSVTVTGRLVDSPTRYEAVAMRVEAQNSDARAFERLVAVAERGCIVANTLRSGVELTVEAVTKTPA
jgi:putative redox protein